MQFFVKSLTLRVTFAFSFLIHLINGRIAVDKNVANESAPEIEPEAARSWKLFFETSQDDKITLTETARRPENIYDVANHQQLLRRSRRSAAVASHKVDHSKKGHASHGHEHGHEHKHSHSSHSNDHIKETKTTADHSKDKGNKDAGVTPAKAAAPDLNKTHDAKEEHNHAAAMAKQDEEKDANEDYDGGDPSAGADVIEPPSSPDITQLSDTCVQLKWTSGALRDKGVKGYKIEYLKGNSTKVFGGMRNWHVVANKIKPRFRIFKVNDLEPNMMYRFRIATIYAGDRYLYGLASGWIKMQRWS